MLCILIFEAKLCTSFQEVYRIPKKSQVEKEANGKFIPMFILDLEIISVWFFD